MFASIFFRLKKNLFSRNYSSSPLCPVCGAAIESIEHLIFDCSFARKVWNCAKLANAVYPAPRSAIFWSNSLLAIKGPQASDLLRKCVALAWEIWKGRNAWCFNGEKFDAS